jgi:2-oxoglutarate dehydrogenase E2 component (dihydrolipoamide succinyltransferase)
VATDVVMPQMGESLAEGTVTKWLKQVGDKIERDEPLFEISTDKVDSVIPAPAGGYVTAILVPEGTTVNINTAVARIDSAMPAGGDASPAPEPAAVAPAPEAAPSSLPRDTSPLGLDVKELVVPKMPPVAPAGGNGGSSARPMAAPSGPASAGHAPLVHPVSGRVLTSPLVKHIARIENLDLRAVPGTGLGGRVTRADVVRAIETRTQGSGAGSAATPAAGGFGLPAPSPSWLPQVQPGDRVEPMSRMRELIAQHMVYSKHTSPHVLHILGREPAADERPEPIGQQLPGPARRRVKHESLSNRMRWLRCRSNRRPTAAPPARRPRPRRPRHHCRDSIP